MNDTNHEPDYGKRTERLPLTDAVVDRAIKQVADADGGVRLLDVVDALLGGAHDDGQGE